MLSYLEIHFFLFPWKKLNPKLLCSASVLLYYQYLLSSDDHPMILRCNKVIILSFLCDYSMNFLIFAVRILTINCLL